MLSMEERLLVASLRVFQCQVTPGFSGLFPVSYCECARAGSFLDLHIC